MILPSPHDVAERIVADAPSQEWLRALTDHLDRRVRTAPLDRLLALWDVSMADVARMMGVSRQALSKWKSDGVPAGRAGTLADLAAATDILDRKLKRERIPAVVRRAVPALDGLSLLDLALKGRTEAVLREVERTFDLSRIQP